MMNTRPSFDPDRVAYFEKAGWQAYYDRNWPRAFRLMVALNREQFRMSFWASLLAAVDIVRASMAFAPQENDLAATSRYIRRFYQKAKPAAKITADLDTISSLELDYWVVHRRLALERKARPDVDNTGPMTDSLTRLHAALFGISPLAARRSAELRALAAKAVDRITGRYSNDVESDWREVESYLKKAYQVVMSNGAK